MWLERYFHSVRSRTSIARGVTNQFEFEYKKNQNQHQTDVRADSGGDIFRRVQ